MRPPNYVLEQKEKNVFNEMLALCDADDPPPVSQVDSDWKADPVLEEACEEVVTAACDPKVSVNPSIQPLTRDNNLIDTGTYNQSINRVL